MFRPVQSNRQPKEKRKRSYWWALRKIFTGTSAEKRLVRYELSERAANLFCDCWLPEDDKLWLQDREFLDIVSRFHSNRRSADRKFAVRELVKALDHVPGDTAECGVYHGCMSYFICQARGRGPHHVFDSFAGLSEPQAEDRPQSAEQIPWQAGEMRVSEAEVRENLKEFPWVEYHAGWIPDRFADVADRQFCFVHLDVDLYQPTIDSLRFFWPRLAAGGMIVCDDYGSTKCPGAKRACDEFGRQIAKPMLHLPTGQGVLANAAQVLP